MKITSLVENTKGEGGTTKAIKPVHGLSLYIETEKHKILFDLGPDGTLFENAERLDVDLSAIDIVIISHGHYDHGGALKRFMSINSTAKIYIQRSAFEPHYSKVLFIKANVGLDKSLMNNGQFVLLDGDYIVDDELSLFTVRGAEKCHSSANDMLYKKGGRDDFAHEQSLIIKEGGRTALIMGCGHRGVVNIMEKAAQLVPHIDICVGGFHLFNPITKKSVSDALLDEIAAELLKYPHTQFYTCHCTGTRAFRYLAKKLTNLRYLHCGDILSA